MKTFSLITILLLSIASVQTAQADNYATYSVSVTFSDTTTFTGKFTYDLIKKQVLSLTGTLYDKAMGDVVVPLTYQLPTPSSRGDAVGGIIATVYAQNTTTVFAPGSDIKTGRTAGNYNAFVTIDVYADNPALGPASMFEIAYADCTPGGLMVKGTICTTGTGMGIGGGTMGGVPTNETIEKIKTPPSPGIYLNKSSLTISLSPNDEVGQNADWWFVAYTPWGQWYSYVYPNRWSNMGTDLGLATPAYQGPLEYISLLPLLDITGLPAGNYSVYFGVDMNKNGVLDFGQLYYSSFPLNIP